MIFSNLKTKGKILLGICSPLVFLLILGAVAAYNIYAIVGSNNWVEHTHKVLADTASLKGSAIDMETGMRGYLLVGRDEFLQPYSQGKKDTYGRLARLQETVSDNPEQVKRLEEAEKVLREWQAKVASPMIDLRRKIGESGTTNDMAKLLTQGKQFFDKFRTILAEFASEEQRLVEIRLSDSKNTVYWTYFTIAICVVSALVLGSMMAWALGRGIANPIKRMTDAMGQLATGDTDVEVPARDRKDEIGEMAQSVEIFRQNAIEKNRIEIEAEHERSRFEEERQQQEKIIEFSLGQVVSAAVEGDLTARIDTAELTGVMERVSSGVNTMLSNVDRSVSETVEVMSALAEGDLTKRIKGDYQGNFLRLKEDANRMADQISEIAGRIALSGSSVQNATNEIDSGVADLSQRTEHQASSLEETTASMEELSATVRKTSDNAQEANQVAVAARYSAASGGEVVSNAVSAMGRIEESSKQITEIVGLIQEIAFQTNLLALNAAVEAARAGDAGKGFAVVANEVRALAQRTGQASKDIKGLITNSDNQVREGAELVNKAGESLKEIVGSVEKVADFVSEIAAASQEQSAGIDQVSRAINSMEELTQQNGALVEETTSALQATRSQVGDLRNIVAFFKTQSGSTPAPETESAPEQIPNPVREQHNPLVQKIGGGAEVAEVDEDWQSF